MRQDALFDLSTFDGAAISRPIFLKVILSPFLYLTTLSCRFGKNAVVSLPVLRAGTSECMVLPTGNEFQPLDDTKRLLIGVVWYGKIWDKQ